MALAQPLIPSAPVLILSSHFLLPSPPTTTEKSRLRIATCYGCRAEIFDQYILQVAPDMEWHASCLKCAECQQFLDENCTCFVKEKKTYCKRDYMR